MIVYRNEHRDAREAQQQVRAAGRRCELLAGDITREAFCRRAVVTAIRALGRLDVLINNAAVQFPQDDIASITTRQLEQTIRTNIFSFFYFVKAALPHLKSGSSIINTTSVTAYRGSAHLLDYASTKGAIVAFTRSLAQALVDKGIRVNAVAPGPIWDPTNPRDLRQKGGLAVRIGRSDGAGREPREVAPSYVFLASDDASYITGQVIPPTEAKSSMADRQSGSKKRRTTGAAGVNDEKRKTMRASRTKDERRARGVREAELTTQEAKQPTSVLHSSSLFSRVFSNDCKGHGPSQRFPVGSGDRGDMGWEPDRSSGSATPGNL